MRRILPLSSSVWRAKCDVARRLGPRAVALALVGRGPWARLWTRWRLGGDAWAIRPMAGGDVRPTWELNRWAELPRMALAGQDFQPFIMGWWAANPPFHGVNWACGQEAAIRALHLALAYRLAGATPPRTVVAALAQRIGANPAYAMAQDNNHPITEAAGLLVCGKALGDAAMARRGTRRLDAAIARLVAADGSFAQASPAYHRLLLDVMACAEWLHPGATSPLTRTRMAAATRWLHRLACPQTGCLPRIGHQDGSHVADLSGAGPDDARASLERAARIFCHASAGWHGDAGCMALRLALPEGRLARALDWRSAGFMGLHSGHARAILRTGPRHFRPGHADLLHLDVWLGPVNLLRDGGTGAYNPPDAYFQGEAHNTIRFDGEDQMPRIGPFLFAHWPETGDLPNGAWLRDHRGRRHAREVFATPRGFRVEDRISGPFHSAALHWRLAPGDWRLTGDGVEADGARLRLLADGPLRLSLAEGRESLAYGVATPIAVLRNCSPNTITRITTFMEFS